MKGNVFAIQHYAVHDGPGIRTLVFLKGCPLRCAWCCNPESQSASAQLRFISFRCRSCHRCMEVCPHAAITPGSVTIDPDFTLCATCPDRPCTDACPHEALITSGREISDTDLMGRIARDIRFYQNSGGGVTFSGGEPFHQPDFLLTMLRKCRDSGIHTAIETCGMASRTALLEAIPLTGLFLFDLKIIDPVSHLSHTGQPVGPILDNLAVLAGRHPEVIIRFPVVPGITDTGENLEGVANLMLKNGLHRIHLEPYHNLGVDKYPEHGMKYSLAGLLPVGIPGLGGIREFFTGQGIECNVV